MEVIDIPLEGREDPQGLRAFLEACREAADAEGHEKLASIALAVRHIDPLAVLDSIYEGDAHHFYMEHPARGWAVAGAEAVVSGIWSGPDRFQAARRFAVEVERHTIAIGDLSLPFSGPLFFGGFTFFEESEEPDGPFPPASLFVPQWQVGRLGNQYVAVANARVVPGMDVGPLAERIWKAHHTFTAFDYDRPTEAPVYHILEETEVGGAVFQDRVRQALRQIESGLYQKIVLSRAVDLRFDNSCQPLRILNRLRRDYPSCSSFSLQSEQGTSFIGATPERLISVQDGCFQTEAIAGSIARDPSAAGDARLARHLLGSSKDLREHRLVLDDIHERLRETGIEATVPDSPGLLVLPNVQHLCTPLSGELPQGRHILDLAETLHPTPAVGGTPRKAVLPDIAAWEPFPRGLFAGLTGFFDSRGNGEFAVGIRSALIRDSRARLYAGAGIVSGSEPDAEFAETSLKMAALLRCIRGAAG